MSTAPSTPVDCDAIDGALGERYYKDRKDLDEKYTKEIIDVIRRAIDEGFQQNGFARRDAHAGSKARTSGQRISTPVWSKN